MSRSNSATNVNLPPPSKLRQILQLLAADLGSIPVSGMTVERQQTVLGATAAALLVAKYNNHILANDPLSDDERYVASISAVAEITGGDGLAGLEFARALLTWVTDLVSEATRDDDGHHSPGPAIRHLLLATDHLLYNYIDAHHADGFELDGKVYHTIAGAPGTEEALLNIRDAAEMISRMLPPKEQR